MVKILSWSHNYCFVIVKNDKKSITEQYSKWILMENQPQWQREGQRISEEYKSCEEKVNDWHERGNITLLLNAESFLDGYPHA